MLSELFWIILGQALTTLGSLVGVRLLTSVVSPESYGGLALGITGAALINQLTSGPISNAATRYYSTASESGTLGPYSRGLAETAVFASGVVWGFLLLGYSLGSVLSNGVGGTVVTCVVIYATLAGYSTVIDGLQTGARQRAVVAWHQTLGTWARFIVAIFVAVFVGGSPECLLLAYSVASAFVLGSQFVFLRSVIKNSSKGSLCRLEVKQWRSSLLNYAWPFIGWGLFTWAQAASDRWSLQSCRSSEEVGLYSVAFQIGYYPVSLLSSLVAQFVTPIIFEKAGSGAEPRRLLHALRENDRYVVLSLALTALLTLTTLLTHKLIFSILVAEEYRSVSYTLPGFSLAAGLFAAGQLKSIALLAANRTKTQLPCKIFTAIAAIAMNYFMAISWGIVGLVAANVLAAFAYLVWTILLVSRIRAESRLAF